MFRGVLKRTFIFCAGTLMFPVFLRAAEAANFSLSLQQAQEKATQTSSILQASKAQAEAAEAQASAAGSYLYPRLSLDGSYYYQTNVVYLNPFGLGPEVPFTYHNNYSVGPMISYNLFDGGLIRKSSASAESLANAKTQDYLSRQKELVLNVQQTYFRAQMSLQSLTLTANALNLAIAQEREIRLGYRAGAASRLDQITAHKEMLGYQLKFKQAQAELSSVLQDLFAMTNDENTYDTQAPVSEEISQSLPKEVGFPTLIVKLDSLKTSLQELSSFAKLDVKTMALHPQIQSLNYMSESAKLSSESQKGNYWPHISIYAKALLVYPNVVFDEQVNNNIFGVNLNFPLYEGGKDSSLSKSYLHNAAAAEFQKKQSLTNFQRDYLKSANLLQNLLSQKNIVDLHIQEAREISRLTYQAYRAGKVTYLEVQTANLKRLEAELQGAQIESQALIQLAVMQYLSGASQ